MWTWCGNFVAGPILYLHYASDCHVYDASICLCLVCPNYSIAVQRHIPLKSGLNEFSGYTEPINTDHLGPPFVYMGFVPASLVKRGNEEGFRVCKPSFTLCKLNSTELLSLIELDVLWSVCYCYSSFNISLKLDTAKYDANFPSFTENRKSLKMRLRL